MYLRTSWVYFFRSKQLGSACPVVGCVLMRVEGIQGVGRGIVCVGDTVCVEG